MDRIGGFMHPLRYAGTQCQVLNQATPTAAYLPPPTQLTPCARKRLIGGSNSNPVTGQMMDKKGARGVPVHTDIGYPTSHQFDPPLTGYTIKNTIGQEAFSKVKLGIHNETRQKGKSVLVCIRLFPFHMSSIMHSGNQNH